VTSAIVLFLAGVGAVTCAVVGIGAVWYLATRRPTPDATVREAVTSIRWRYAAAFFMAPCAAVGIMEFGGLSGLIIGAAVGAIPVVQMVLMSWWFGPL
jgi:hypothetical protein